MTSNHTALTIKNCYEFWVIVLTACDYSRAYSIEILLKNILNSSYKNTNLMCQTPWAFEKSLQYIHGFVIVMHALNLIPYVYWHT